MHMMTREIILGRKTEGTTVSSINCDRSSLIYAPSDSFDL